MATSSNPRSLELRDKLAKWLAILGKPHEAVIEALEQKWPLVPKQREYVEAFDRFLAAVEAGRFTEADAVRRRGEELVAQPGSSEPGQIGEFIQFDLDYLSALKRQAEAADSAAASREAQRSVGRRGVVLDRASMLDARTRSCTPGGSRPAEFDQRRATWISAAKKEPGAEPWAVSNMAFAKASPTREDAEGARRSPARPEEPPLPWAGRTIGIALVLAGRGADALGLPAATSCPARRPETFRARALEDAGRTDEACAEYARVLARYGQDKLVPLAVKDAKSHASALHCKPAP